MVSLSGWRMPIDALALVHPKLHWIALKLLVNALIFARHNDFLVLHVRDLTKCRLFFGQAVCDLGLCCTALFMALDLVFLQIYKDNGLIP